VEVQDSAGQHSWVAIVDSLAIADRRGMYCTVYLTQLPATVVIAADVTRPGYLVSLRVRRRWRPLGQAERKKSIQM
jgi:hypothetical protein